MADILENAEANLTPMMRNLIDLLWNEWKLVEQQIEELTNKLEQISASDAGCCRIRKIPGVGPIVATATPGSAAEIRSSSRLSPLIWSSTVFHSFQRRSIRSRICVVRSRSAFSRISGIAIRSFAGVFAKTRPRSSRNARSWLMTAVRREMRRSRTRWMACRSS